MSKPKGKQPAKGKRTGRPPRAFTREEIDEAVNLIGVEVYTSRIVGRLREKFPRMGRELCYRLVSEARAEVLASIAGGGENAVGQLYASYLAVIANPAAKDVVKVQALNGASKLLGTTQLVKGIQEAGSVEEYLATVLARQAARTAQQTAPTTPPTGAK